jgi:phosphatidylinositol alpha-1,6-mannosyltransferase
MRSSTSCNTAPDPALVSDRQKVLYLTPGCFDKGGISRYSRYQIAALRQILGPRQVRAYSLLAPDADGFEEPFSTNWHGAHVSARRRDRIAMAARLLGETLAWRPDVIHSAHVNFSPLVRFLARTRGAHAVLNVYGLELWSGLTQPRRRAMLRHDRIIADCHATAAYVADHKLHPQPSEVVWDCVDLDRFRPGPAEPGIVARYGLPDPASHPIVMTLGRLAKGAVHKGFDRLIRAFPDVLARVPEARLVIAGKGDDRPRLEAIARDCGVAAMVTFAGAVDEADLPAFYRCARVFSLVSDKGHGRGEGIPLTPLEAMACGVPVVVGNEDGSREAVDGARNGRVVSPRSQGELAAALVALLVDADEPGRQARSVAEERFGYPAFVAKLSRIYAGLRAA